MRRRHLVERRGEGTESAAECVSDVIVVMGFQKETFVGGYDLARELGHTHL
jgi:hypothetical protein